MSSQTSRSWALVLTALYYLAFFALAVALGSCASARKPQVTHLAPDSLLRAAAAAPRLGTLIPGAKPTFFLSTAAGSARRQARKDARAAVPRSIGKGAVYAVNAQVVNGGNKPRAAVTNADTGAVVTIAAQNAQLQAAVGDGNQLHQTPPRGHKRGLLDTLRAYAGWGLLALALVYSFAPLPAALGPGWLGRLAKRATRNPS